MKLPVKYLAQANNCTERKNRKQGWKDLDPVKSGWVKKIQVDELIVLNAVVNNNEKQCCSQLDGGNSEYL